MGPSAIQEPGFVVQTLCMLAVCGTTINNGFCCGWATLIVALEQDTRTNVSLDQEDIQLLVTVGCVFGFIGPFLAGGLSEVFGPRSILLVTMLFPIVLWPLLAFVPLRSVIWAARIGLSIANYIFLNITASLSAELVSPNIRGMLGVLPLICLWSGIVAVFVLIRYLSWHLVCFIGACPAAVLMIALFFVPESPYWLLRKERVEDARRSLEILRGRGTDVNNEFESIKIGIEQQPSYTFKDEFSQLFIPSNYKPILIMVVVLLASNMTGYFVIFLYAYLIIPEIGVTDFDPMTAIITLAIAGFVSSGISSFLLDRCGRRPLLIGSALMSAASLLAASILMIYPVLPGWSVLIFIHAFVFGTGLGSNTVPTVLTGEMIPTAVRYIGVAICMLAIALAQSLLAYVFPVMVSNIGLSYTFMTCSFFSVFLAVFTWKWVPETKGKSLVELQKEFMNPRSQRLYSRISICKQSSKAGIDISPKDLKRLTDIALNAIQEEDKNITRYRQRSKIYGDILQEYNRNKSSSI
ncbi:facilitated trehalose transporter Tret1-like [Oratosquilla oratoria]|uniref:facilitated trehalose transporter Tret1-like n=1 Tax=Oratosquilla oratoria TaxID=337810 RepID=UPI003F75CF73